MTTIRRGMGGRGRSGNTVQMSVVGSVRSAQLLHTFGVGSIAELPNFSVLISGLHDWRYETKGADGEPVSGGRWVEEPRLLEIVRKLDPRVDGLRTPPWRQETSNPGSRRIDPSRRIGIQADPFPTFFVCRACRGLIRIGSRELEFKPDLSNPDRAHFEHRPCGRQAAPTRFVVACAKGHLDDFPYELWAHNGRRCSKFEPTPGRGVPRMTLTTDGDAGRATMRRVTCDECNSSRSIDIAFRHNAQIGECSGWHAHMARPSPQPCDAPAKALLVGATDLWFPDFESALSLQDPREAKAAGARPSWYAELRELGPEERLDTIDSGRWRQRHDLPDTFEEARRVIEEYGLATTDSPSERQLSAADVDRLRLRLLAEEWQVLTDDRDVAHELLEVRTVSRPDPAAYPGSQLIRSVKAVPRLREVKVFLGFSRLMPPSATTSSRYLGHGNWRTAVENFGEGIFLTLDPELVRAWQELASVRAWTDRMQDLLAGRDRSRGVEPPRESYAAFAATHTFSHALIRQIAIQCGYPAPSIMERVYSQPDAPGVGLLIFTAERGSAGTLGGLVELANPDRLGPLITAALDEARICPNDPYCADHQPGGVAGIHDETLHGAACHTCLFLPETSCAHLNRYLDRSLVVDTLAIDGPTPLLRA